MTGVDQAAGYRIGVVMKVTPPTVLLPFLHIAILSFSLSKSCPLFPLPSVAYSFYLSQWIIRFHLLLSSATFCHVPLLRMSALTIIIILYELFPISVCLAAPSSVCCSRYTQHLISYIQAMSVLLRSICLVE